MTDVLHLSARPGAPIVCDMSAAPDTPAERLLEYERLFGRALVRRERFEHAVVFAFRGSPGTREHVEDLAHREAACCPFLTYRVETAGDEVVLTVENPITGPERADAQATLDAFFALPDHAGSGGAQLLDG